MITKALQRGAANSWRQSSSKYGGRSWPLIVVMLSNLTATTLFGGSIMLFAVALIETGYAMANPDRATWFSGGALQALIAYAAFAFVVSMLPMALTAGINKLYRQRCKTCRK